MVYIILGAGFEDIETVVPYDILVRSGLEVKYLSLSEDLSVLGGHKTAITAHDYIGNISLTKNDTVIVPGGMGGVRSIKSSSLALDFIKKAYEMDLYLCAICAGPSVLADLGILDGKIITCYPGCENMMGRAICHSETRAMKDGKIITGRSAGCSFDFGFLILKALKGEGVYNSIAQELYY